MTEMRCEAFLVISEWNVRIMDMTNIQLIIADDLSHFKTLMTADNKFVACKFIRDPHGVAYGKFMRSNHFRICER